MFRYDDEFFLASAVVFRRRPGLRAIQDMAPRARSFRFGNYRANLFRSGALSHLPRRGEA